MKIGIPKEIKSQENRVGMTPAGVHQLSGHGHSVFVEKGAGVGSGIPDADFIKAGATMIAAEDVWNDADLIVKVKEPIACEYQYLREDQVLFTYLHLAADQPQVDALMQSKITSIAYETVELDNGALPLLAPMSEVAGRMSLIVGSVYMLKHFGGSGTLISGVPGVAAPKVVVLGAGVAGTNAAQMAFGLHADVTVLDVDLTRLAQLDVEFQGHVKTVYSTVYSVERAVADADLVVGSVLVAGARAPKLVSHDLICNSKPGCVYVDISIDQGGCFEGSRPTTHAEPVFMIGDSVMYGVANMPGAVPHTSTYALTNATLEYVTQIANKGWKQAMRENRALARGLSSSGGHLTSEPVAEYWNYDWISIDSALD